MKEQDRMWLRFVYADGSTTDIEVGKFTSIKASPGSKVKFHVNCLPDGKHLVIADESVLQVDDKSFMATSQQEPFPLQKNDPV